MVSFITTTMAMIFLKANAKLSISQLLRKANGVRVTFGAKAAKQSNSIRRNFDSTTMAKRTDCDFLIFFYYKITIVRIVILNIFQKKQ